VEGTGHGQKTSAHGWEAESKSSRSSGGQAYRASPSASAQAANAAVQHGAPPPLIPVQAPIFNASTVQIQGTGNDFSLMFLRSIPVSQGDHVVSPNLAMQQVVVTLQLSPHTLKDLSLLLPPVVERFEKDFGTIGTPYTKRLAAEQKLANAKPASSKRN
jgi:hypothetical protein